MAHGQWAIFRLNFHPSQSNVLMSSNNMSPYSRLGCAHVCLSIFLFACHASGQRLHANALGGRSSPRMVVFHERTVAAQLVQCTRSYLAHNATLRQLKLEVSFTLSLSFLLSSSVVTALRS